MRPEDEPDPVNLDEWAVTRETLSALLYEALRQPEIEAALAESDITDLEAGQAVLDDQTVLARVRMELDEARRGRHETNTFGAGKDSTGRSRLSLREIRQLLVVFLLGAGYLSLMRATWADLAFVDHVLVVIGFVATIAISARMAIARVPEILTYFGFDEPEGVPDDTLGLGERRNVVLVTLVVPELMRYIERRRTREYSTTLRSRQVTNLYIDDEVDVVITEPAERLVRALKRAGSGAIALAGQRGTGKTTAIQAILQGRFQSPDGPPSLTVVAAAPALYEARDFVLHLHALLCHAVVGKIDDLVHKRREESWDSKAEAWARIVAILISMGMIAAAVFGGSQLLGMTVPAFLEELKRSAVAVWNGFPEAIPGVFFGGSILRGIVLVASVLVAAYTVRLAFSILVGVFEALRWVWRRISRRSRDPLRALKTEAKDQLQRIRFLQTFTSGWSGKISTPLKGEAGRTWQAQRAEQQLTHPEVVEKFRQFAQRSAQVFIRHGVIDRIVIAIDELDKIGEPEKAHEFVNDIKGVFGVPGCIFLVSVSDDAFTTFEQRGIAVRDAFDSAFAEMIRMEHFTLDESRHWIGRRLPGAPEQFTVLCHCMSGGLPRDLRRCVVEMLDVSFDLYNPPLSAVVARMVRHEVVKKAHAFAGTARAQEVADGLSDLMADLLTARSVTTAGEMIELASSLSKTDESYPRLRAQSSTFLLFCATVLEVFTDELDEEALRDTKVETLATVRQQMAVEPQVARRLLLTFRKEQGLELG
ncbi:hypothetical protein [Kibdelosporangium aridum]|uniref:hypothetical protein n=1 Tax=Kibdelosporangium aridum TaxID=2030 RepID=UPI0035EEEF04